jgi:hypothetical protein
LLPRVGAHPRRAGDHSGPVGERETHEVSAGAGLADLAVADHAHLVDGDPVPQIADVPDLGLIDNGFHVY